MHLHSGPSLRSPVALGALIVTVSVALVIGQTKVTVPSNKYTPAQDVQLGKDAAAEARKQLPLMGDSTVSSYVAELGKRLAAAIPTALQHSEFQYTFETVNVREINAFALPGGPMFVNRGMIEAAKSEGEVAGVMAHELSHVVLRHGTAQASKARPFEFGQLAGAIAGAIIGGTAGNVVAQATSFGLGTAFMKYSRAFEKDADIEGAQIMARAGYDPREMANMFKTIEAEGKNGPEFLSDHPNPGNRVDYITKEAAALRVENAQRDTAGFARVVAYLKTLPKAPTTEEATAAAKKGGSASTGTGAPRQPSGPVTAPSARYTQYKEGDLFTVTVPSNWRERSQSSVVTFAPDGGYDASNSGSFSHGVQFAALRNEGHDLQTATDELIASLRQGNPQMSRPSPYRRTSVSGRTALQANMTNVADAAGNQEIVQVVTVQTSDGNLFYVVAVAPLDDSATYQPVFQRVIASVRFVN